MVAPDSERGAPSVTVETPTSADTDAIVDLWVDLARDQRRHGSSLRAETNRRVARETVGRHLVAGGVQVARDDGLAGMVLYEPERGAFDRTVDRGVVTHLYVVPERRGEGIGSALLDAAEADLRASGVEVVALQAMADNEAARDFYERRGYRAHRVEFEKEVESDILPRKDR
ncbi:MAG: GNAT family N-acetyltransferase [Haloplanus sp.]